MKRARSIIFCLILCLLTACATPMATQIPALNMAPYGGESCETVRLASADLEQTSETLPVYQMEIASVSEMKAEIARVMSLSFDEATRTNSGTQYWMYRIGDADIMLDEELGFWTYQLPQEIALPEQLPTDEEAIAIADAFLAEAQLYHGALRPGIVSNTTTGITGTEEVLNKDIYYYPEFDGMDVYGVFRIVIGIGDHGQIISVSKQVQDVTEAARVPLAAPETLQARLDAGDCVSSPQNPVAEAEVKSGRLAYYSDITPSHGKLYLHPIYDLTAAGTNELGETETFSVWVSAAADA